MPFEASTAPPPPTLKMIIINPRVHPFTLDLVLCEDLGFRPSGLDYSAPRAALPQPRPMPFSRLEEWCSGVVRPRGRTQATAGFVPEGEETREGAGGEDFGRWGGPGAGRRRGAGHRSRRPSSAVTETGAHQAPSLRPKRGTRCTACTPRTPRGPGLAAASEFRDGAVGRAGLSQRDGKKTSRPLRIAKFAKDLQRRRQTEDEEKRLQARSARGPAGRS